MSCILGPKAPFGSPFESSFFPKNAGMNFLGSIPIVGIFVGQTHSCSF